MDADLREFLVASGLVAADARVTCDLLPGGVSCDVWKIETDARTICVKRALPRLRVETLWEAPVARNTHEWDWINYAARTVPGSVPQLLVHDPDRAMFAMEFLEPARFPIWKQLLLAGTVDATAARDVAHRLARFHGASAGVAALASRFDTDAAFFALRIEPYLLEAARRNPRVSDALEMLAKETLATKIALVHGDVSPKNILVGPEGPVFLDAETAWYGDPAFDLAFCLNHLLLKCLARPKSHDAFLSCFAEFCRGYLDNVAWEDAATLEKRAARLLPALLLARVDGKSPVEYLSPTDHSFVREFAGDSICDRAASLEYITDAWRTALTRGA
jgi:5-methylthioribose kinase